MTTPIEFSHLDGAPMPETVIVIYSALAAQQDLDVDLVGGFWNHESGWGSIESATLFTAAEDVTLPTFPDARKVTLAEAYQIVSLLNQELAEKTP